MDILERLRSATGEAHRRLEDDLDLLAHPLDRDRFALVLERFHGFHAVWEAALARYRWLDELMHPRRKLHLLTRDLAALGRGGRDYPLCVAAQDLTRSADHALGSLYVMEGSTLGGKVISRALVGAPWLPSGGLSYFDPYGAETGAMWRGVQVVLRKASSPERDQAIEDGARDTFALLHDWLARA